MFTISKSEVFITSDGRKFLDREEAISVERGLLFTAFAEKYGFSSMDRSDLASILENNYKELHDLFTQIEGLDRI